MGILPCCELGNFICSGPHMFPVVLPLNRLIAHTNQVHHGDGEARISQSGAFFTQAGPHCVCPGNSCKCAPVASGRYSPKRSSKQRANMRCSSGSRARKIITSSTRSGTSVMATGRSRRLRRMRASCEMFFCTRLIHYSMHEHKKSLTMNFTPHSQSLLARSASNQAVLLVLPQGYGDRLSVARSGRP